MKKSIFKVVLLASIFALGISAIGSEAAALDKSQMTTVLHSGQVTLRLLSDGNAPGNPGIIRNATEQDYEKYMPKKEFTSAINAFLITTADKTILVDTGLGQEIFANLEYLNVKPEDIDIVLITHMHGDHINGLLRDGKVAFPNADVYVATKEFAYWQDKPSADFLRPYAERVKYIEPGQLEDGGSQILPGICAIAAYGHTPGHTMYLLKDGGKEVLLWGDITHVTPLQIPMPEIFVTYDVDSQQAVAVRQKVIAYAAGRNLSVAGAHIQSPGMLTIQADNDSYKYDLAK